MMITSDYIIIIIIIIIIRDSGGSLWMRKQKFGLSKMLGISWLAEDVLASQEGLHLG
jgi:hypothetical protein